MTDYLWNSHAYRIGVRPVHGGLLEKCVICVICVILTGRLWSGIAGFHTLAGLDLLG